MPSPLTVFLIDDDPSVRRALARLIKSAGYQVQPFVSAREFLDRMPDAAGPGCLVLDVDALWAKVNGVDAETFNANCKQPMRPSLLSSSPATVIFR